MCIAGNDLSNGHDLSQVCLFNEADFLYFSCSSDEDTDVKAVVQSWLAKEPAETRSITEKFINEYFFDAFNWVTKHGDFVVETTLIGTVLNGLSHLHGVHDRALFTLGLIRGLGGNLTEKTKEVFAREVNVFLLRTKEWK